MITTAIVNTEKKDETRERKRMNEWSTKNLTAGEDGSYYSPAMQPSPMADLSYPERETAAIYFTQNTWEKNIKLTDYLGMAIIKEDCSLVVFYS